MFRKKIFTLYLEQTHGYVHTKMQEKVLPRRNKIINKLTFQWIFLCGIKQVFVIHYLVWIIDKFNFGQTILDMGMHEVG